MNFPGENPSIYRIYTIFATQNIFLCASKLTLSIMGYDDKHINKRKIVKSACRIATISFNMNISSIIIVKTNNPQ